MSRAWVSHIQFRRVCENINEISQVFQVDSVLDNRVRSDRFRDSGDTDVPSHHGHDYVHAVSSKVTRSRRLREKESLVLIFL
jgi:hypothetical protein